VLDSFFPQIVAAQEVSQIKLASSSQSGGEDIQEIKSINEQLKEKKDKINQLQEKIKDYQRNIDYQRRQTLSLANQIAILNNQIKKLEAEIELKQSQIDQTKLEIKDTENKIQEAETNILIQKSRLTNFLKKLNKLDQKNSIEIILTVNSFSDYYNHLRTLEILQNNTRESLGGLKKFKADLAVHLKELGNKKDSLENLLAELNKKKINLTARSYAKQSLLTESRNSESRFKSLVAQLKAEQNAINADIIALEKKIRQKLSRGNKSKLNALGGPDFSWPVPNRGITAYFHDPSYPFRYIFEHPAIDIKSAQGSPIRAAAAGYVGKVRDGGYGYSYIMIIHGNGFATVYGHVSKILVKQDQFVTQGEIIGLSGGMPGTPGAGRLSTGPHLHFEIRKNGIPVNPLDYLP